MKNLKLSGIISASLICLLSIGLLACSNGKKGIMEKQMVTTTKPNDPKANPRKIIKEANISFLTKNLKETDKEVKEIIKKYNAYVSEENQFKHNNRIGFDFTIRVPSEKFDSLTSQILDSLDIKEIEQKDIKLLDVTEEYIDMEARVKVKKETEKKYLNLLGKSKNISETIEIEKQLTALRSEIEADEGKFKCMDDKVIYSTLNLSFYEETKYSSQFFSETWTALKDGWQIFLHVVTFLCYLWVVMVAILLGRWAYKRYKKLKRLNKFKS